jgi:RNase P subunit RPR2
MKDHKLTHMSEDERAKFFATTTSKRYLRMQNQTRRGPPILSSVTDKTCPVCEKVFVTPSAMKNHLNSKHERKVIFNCDVCQRGFFRKDSLRIHERTHLTLEEKEQLTLAKSEF